MATRTTEKRPTTSSPKIARNPKAQNPGATSGSKPAFEATVAVPSGAAAPKAPTKIDIILGLLARTEGATLEQMVEATGWLPHTTRAALTGLKKKGRPFTSSKANGVRTYHLVATGRQKGSKTSVRQSAREA
jgi:hypothetical protein